MGTCGSASNKRDQQSKNDNQPSKSRSNPNKERTNKTNSIVDKPKEEIKDNLLTIIIKEKGETILNGQFEREKTIEEIYTDLILDPTRDYDVLYNGKQITFNPSTKLKDAFDINKNTIELTVNYTGLDIADNCRTRYEETTNFIGSIDLNNNGIFTLVIYDKSTQNTNVFNYTFESDHILQNFGLFSAFCNANNKIYLSGGELQTSSTITENVRVFVEINLATANREMVDFNKLPDLNEARTWHSMIFVPDTKIFIVGGHDSQTVEVYDMISNTIDVDSKMNDQRSECTLCLVNSCYLYAFGGFILHQSFVKTIERCNLRKKIRTWENVDINYENNIEVLTSFSAVGYNKDKLFLLGGKDREEKNYLIDIDNKHPKVNISEYTSFEDIAGVYKEKFFIPINSNESALIPIGSTNIRVLLMDERTGEISKREYNLVEDSER